MNTENSIFKFVTIRNVTSEVKSESKSKIQPSTEVTNSLVTVLKSEKLKLTI